MGASLEWHIATIRIGKDHERYGDPYEAACTVIRCPDGTAYLLSMESAVGLPRHRQEVFDLLRQHGFKKACWTRRRKDEWKKVEVRL